MRHEGKMKRDFEKRVQSPFKSAMAAMASESEKAAMSDMELVTWPHLRCWQQLGKS